VNFSERLLSDLELARAQFPGVNDAALVVRFASQTLDELGLEPPIDPRMVASYRGIARIVEVADLPYAGCLTPDEGEVIAKIRAGDSPRRRRFTAFHEIKHSYLPGFRVSQFRCDPDSPAPRSGTHGESVEYLADLGASELLLPRRHFQADLDGNGLDLDLVLALSDRYDASLEATAIRTVELAGEDALLISLALGARPSEPDAEPALRVRWSRAHGSWPYVPRHKSVTSDSPFGRALLGEVVEECVNVDGLTREPINNVHVSARLFPYLNARGETQTRVLAMLTSAA
jgi:hypothetical protein